MFSKVRFTNMSNDQIGQLTPLGVIALYSQFLTFFRKFPYLLQKSSPLKLLGQIKPKLATINIDVSSLKFVFFYPANQPRWPPWLKIEHRGKMQFLAYISKTKAFRANLTRGKIVYLVKIYLP
jgi:hypothetical protein